ncbi:MAG: hypothetical protein KAI17_12440, partial [Thiotrichaceae bacterium]|nr:hypothetical protein [Thiotrichaceae bacterium]
GIVDDIKGMKPWTKLLGQVLAVLCMYFLYGKDIDFLGFDSPLYVDLIFILGWYLVIINAFNLIDGLDGLCSGLAIISSLGLAVVYILQSASSSGLICLILAGACIGFLRYNFHPARIFLGDSGSMFLGFTLASISLYAGAKSSFFVTLATPFFIAGIPIIDTLLAIWRRSIRKVLSEKNSPVKVMQPDKEHLHHRLMEMGLKQHHVALVLYAVNAAIVISGLIYIFAVNISTGFFLIIFVITVYLLVKHVIQIELWETSRIFANSYKNIALSRINLIFYPLFDLFWLSLSFTLAIFIVFEGQLHFRSMSMWISALPSQLMPTFLFLFLTHSYNKVWRNSFFKDYLFLTFAIFTGCIISLAIECFLNGGLNFFIVNRTLLFCLFSFIGIIGIRIPHHFIREWSISATNPSPDASPIQNILLYGAGTRGGLYIRERYLLHSDELGSKNIIGFIDDDKALRKQYLYGKVVLGNLDDLKQLVSDNKINEVVITTFLSDENYQILVNTAQELGFKVSDWRAYSTTAV